MFYYSRDMVDLVHSLFFMVDKTELAYSFLTGSNNCHCLGTVKVYHISAHRVGLYNEVPFGINQCMLTPELTGFYGAQRSKNPVQRFVGRSSVLHHFIQTLFELVLIFVIIKRHTHKPVFLSLVLCFSPSLTCRNSPAVPPEAPVLPGWL